MSGNLSVIKQILRKKALVGSALNLVSSLFALVGSLVIIACTYTLLYCLVVATTNAWVRQPSSLFFEMIALGLMAAIFIANAFVLPEEYHADLSAWTMDATAISSPLKQAFFWVLGPLCFGPRLFTMSAGMLAKSIRLWCVDIESCARVVEFAAPHGKRIPLDTIIHTIPLPNAFRTFSNLRDFDGVIFAGTNPVGLSFTNEFRRAFDPDTPEGEVSSEWYDPVEQPPKLVYEREPLTDAMKRVPMFTLIACLLERTAAAAAYFVLGAIGGLVVSPFVAVKLFLFGTPGTWLGPVYLHRMYLTKPEELLAVIPLCVVGGAIGAVISMPPYQYPWKRKLVMVDSGA